MQIYTKNVKKEKKVEIIFNTFQKTLSKALKNLKWITNPPNDRKRLREP